ncbi:MAG: cyclophilin family peptidyl-prolyl cis-trans isomerase [Algoriphagus sp.]|jgi:cyclophilin family peptidyl-prolyl cis-trans isomerase
MKKILTVALISACLAAQGQKKKDYLITLRTEMGTMQIVLFDETPLHKANFLKLAESGFYDSTLFHRVISEFMIQGGDPNTKKEDRLKNGGGDMEKIPFEFVPEHVHIKGALSAARTNNPEKASSGSQFYIVTGKKYKAGQLKRMDAGVPGIKERAKLEYTSEQIEAYEVLGGTPFLDNRYTVFGQVISGIETAEKIEKVDKDRSDRPTEDISMLVSVKKMRKKKITKRYGYKYN